MTPRNASDRFRPVDQAHGLRRLFAGARLHLVPVVANPHMAMHGVLLERLCAALTLQGVHTLLVDAADSAPPAGELATLDLADGVERLTPSMSYLAARGLPLRFVDAHGSTASFLQAAVDAAPHAEVVLVHAGASDLARMLARQTIVAQVLPLLLADDRPASVTHAYAAMKWLAMRAGLRVHHLVLEASPSSPRAPRIAEQLAQCAETFLGALLQDWTLVDPAGHADDDPPEALCRLARTLLGSARPAVPAAHAAAARFRPAGTSAAMASN